MDMHLARSVLNVFRKALRARLLEDEDLLLISEILIRRLSDLDSMEDDKSG